MGKKNPQPGQSSKSAANPRAPKPGANRNVWVGSKKPVFMFVGTFVLLMGLFYAITFVDALEKNVLPGLMRLNASASAMVMNVFGEGAEADGTTLRSKRNSVNIAHGCDAIEPIALFVAAVIAFPAPWKTKLPGLLIGTFVLTALNIVRIISLFYVGIWKPSWFDRMHEDVWQPAFIVFSLFFWVVWALWATKPAARSQPPPPATPPQPPAAGPRDAHALA